MQHPVTVLYFLSYWPRRSHSAASDRIFAHLSALTRHGFNIILAADEPLSEGLSCEVFRDIRPAASLHLERMKINDPRVTLKIAEIKPHVVLFDKYTSEEKYSWQVHKACPEALRILDTVDLHSLRKGREILSKQNLSISGAQDYLPALYAAWDIFLKESAAILRSDVTLIVSDAEKAILENWPLFCTTKILLQSIGQQISNSDKNFPSLLERRDFYFIGHYQHPPNKEAIFWLKKTLWPQIKARFATAIVDNPTPKLHIFSAGMREDQRKSLHDPKEHFLVHGPKANVSLGSFRVNLAPLRSGAGIKGKIAEGWAFGTPCVTTTIGAEGMFLNQLASEEPPLIIPHEHTEGKNADKSPFGGLIADQDQLFAEYAFQLYTRQEIWLNLSQLGQKILKSKFDPEQNGDILVRAINDSLQNLEGTRRKNLISPLLMQESLRSTEYFSRWLQAKIALSSEITKNN